MAPKNISSDIFKNRRELPSEIYDNLVVDGGIERVKQLLQEKWNYSPEHIVAVPCLTINNVGKIGGVKWHIAGVLGREINFKVTQLNPNAEEDTFVCIKNIDLAIFPFYNKRRNVSGWIDSSELEYSVFRKARSKKQQIQSDQYQEVGMRGFSLRVGILPVSANTANLTVALHPMSKEELKMKAPDCYYKNTCPQVALPVGENNARQLMVKMAVEEPSTALVGLGVLPIIEDVRRTDGEALVRPSSWDVRVALHSFLRSCKGMNNKSAKKTLEAMEDIATEAAKSLDPEFLWPEHAAAEGEDPVDDLGEWHEYCITSIISLDIYFD